MRNPRTATKSSPHSLQLEKSLCSHEDAAQPKVKQLKYITNEINKIIFKHSKTASARSDDKRVHCSLCLGQFAVSCHVFNKASDKNTP